MRPSRALLLAAGLVALVGAAALAHSWAEEREQARACAQDARMLCGFQHGFAAAISRGAAAGLGALALALGGAGLVALAFRLPAPAALLALAVVAGGLAVSAHLLAGAATDAAMTCDSATTPSCYVPHWKVMSMGKAARNVAILTATLALAAAAFLARRRPDAAPPEPGARPPNA